MVDRVLAVKLDVSPYRPWITKHVAQPSVLAVQ